MFLAVEPGTGINDEQILVTFPKVGTLNLSPVKPTLPYQGLKAKQRFK